MDKKVLRTVLEGLQAGSEVDVQFRGEQRGLSGTFKVLESKRWRGRCGSRLASLQSLTGGNTVSIGTPWNGQILNITVNGQTFGSTNETDEVRVYPTNDLRQVELKEQFRALLGEPGIGRKVRVTSTIEPAFNGTFTVTGAELMRGRYGQIRLFCTADNGGEKTEFWTYRHSAAIETFEIL